MEWSPKVGEDDVFLEEECEFILSLVVVLLMYANELACPMN
jgi:hypothetical protein